MVAYLEFLLTFNKQSVSQSRQIYILPATSRWIGGASTCLRAMSN